MYSDSNASYLVDTYYVIYSDTSVNRSGGLDICYAFEEIIILNLVIFMNLLTQLQLSGIIMMKPLIANTPPEDGD